MIAVFNKNVGQQKLDNIRKSLQDEDLPFFLTFLYDHWVAGSSQALPVHIAEEIEKWPELLKIFPGRDEFPLASLKWKNKTTIEIGNEVVGGKEITMVAGPCAVESEAQVFNTAEHLSGLGIKFIRGGAYKPRTSPYAFQGMAQQGLKIIRNAADEFGMQVVTEVIDLSVLDSVYQYADVLQIGSRNMHNYHFLKQLGQVNKPILLKRGMYAKVSEWLLAAEYILSHGNGNVILCERGIRTFDELVRNTLDISAVPLVQGMSHLPVFVDPSQGTGVRNLVGPMSLAAVAAGADGLLIEVHPRPEKALSDGPQQLYLDQLDELMGALKPLALAVNRTMKPFLKKTLQTQNQ